MLLKVTKFKLDDTTDVVIPITHPLYNDVLIASIANQDIKSVLKLTNILTALDYTNAFYDEKGKLTIYL